VEAVSSRLFVIEAVTYGLILRKFGCEGHDFGVVV
jgi:hypothetical protein